MHLSSVAFVELGCCTFSGGLRSRVWTSGGPCVVRLRCPCNNLPLNSKVSANSGTTGHDNTKACGFLSGLYHPARSDLELRQTRRGRLSPPQTITGDMAVSPLITHPAPSDSATTAGKGKTIAVRSSVNGSGHGVPTTTEAEPELAEQLNEETKRRYVKGLFISIRQAPKIPI